MLEFRYQRLEGWGLRRKSEKLVGADGGPHQRPARVEDRRVANNKMTALEAERIKAPAYILPARCR